MKTQSIALILLMSLAGCGMKESASTKDTSIVAGNFVSNITEDCKSENCLGLRKEFDLVVYTGKKIYCYWDLKKAATQNDFDSIAKNLKATITDTTTVYEYYLVLQKWAGSLQDGHVNVMWGDDLTDLESYKVPLRLELLAPGTDHESLIISKTSIATKKLPVGAIVTKVNGQDAIERINELEKYMSGSTSRMRRRGAANMLFSMMKTRDEERSSVKMDYIFKGQTLTTELPRNITLPVKAAAATAESKIDYSTLMQAQILPNNIGYLKVDSFSGADMATLLTRTMKLLSHTKALIIDVRENGGGNQSGSSILGWLTTTPIIRYHANLRISDLLLADRGYVLLDAEYNEGDEFTPFAPVTVFPQESAYKGKVYALTSAFCFSACDTFVSALKENKLATIVGEGTGGGTGTPHVFELPFSGLNFRYSVAQGLTAVNKTFLEGVGTLPDITIYPTVEERISGEDLQLLKAINIAAESINESTIEMKDLQDSGIKSKAPQSDSYSIIDYDNEIKQSMN